MIDMAFVGLTPLLVVVGGYLVFRKLSGRFASRRVSEPRSIVWRIVTGALGIGLVVGVVVGTISDVDQAYAESLAKVTVRVPANPPLQLAGDEDSRAGTEVAEPARVLIHLVFLDVSYGAERLLHVETIDFVTSQESTQKKRFTISQAGLIVTLTLRDPSLYWDSENNACVHGHLKMRVESSFGSSEIGRGGRFQNGTRVMAGSAGYRGGNVRSPFTLTASVPAPHVRSYWFATPIETDDALTTIDGPTYLDRVRPQLAVSQDEDKIRHRASPMILPGLALIGWSETAGFTLLLAAVCLAQAFPRRTAAFTCALALVIGVAAILERATLESHIHNLHAKDSSVRDRGVAADQMANCFFFRETAEQQLLRAKDQHQDLPNLTRSFAVSLERLKHFRHP